MEQEPVQESKLSPTNWKPEPNSKEGYGAASQRYKAKNGKTYTIYRAGLDPGSGSTTIWKLKGEKKYYTNPNELLKRLDGMKESVELEEGAVKDAIMDFFESLPKASHKELLAAAKSKNRNAVAAALKKHKVKPTGKMVRNEKEMVDLILDWWPDMYDMFEETEVTGDDITEKVDLDARTGPFKRTVERLSYQRSVREGRVRKERWEGLYDDGSGRGAMIPEPINMKKENNRFQKELDGRMKSFKEAMRRIEMYREMREKKKKMITMQSEGKLLGMQNSIEQSVVMKDGKFTLPETKLSPDQKKYRAFFKSALAKFGKSSPDKMNDAEKKKFFQYVKSNWKGGAGVKEETETVDEARFKPRQRVKLVANNGGLRTNLHHPKGKAVLDKSGKVVAIYKSEKAARQHAMTGKAVKEDIDVVDDEFMNEIDEAKNTRISAPGKGQTVKNRMWELASYAMHTLWAFLNPFFKDDPGEFTGKKKATVEKMYADGLARWNRGDYKWIVDNLLQKTARLYGTSDFWSDMTWGESEHGFYGGGNWTGPGFDPKKGKASERSKIVK